MPRLPHSQTMRERPSLAAILLAAAVIFVVGYYVVFSHETLLPSWRSRPITAWLRRVILFVVAPLIMGFALAWWCYQGLYTEMR